MLRTTFYLPEQTNIRLKQAAILQRKSASEIVRELLERELDKQGFVSADRVYKAFEQLKGLGGKGTKYTVK